METRSPMKNSYPQSNQILSERVVEHEVVVPKRVVREEVIEKMIVVPETIVREEIVEEVQTVRETIIEIAKPVIHEKIVEVPEVEYRDKIVEVVEKVKQEKIVEVPKIIYQDRYFEVPKIITQEKIIEIPNIEIKEEIIEKIVEIPQIQEKVIVKELAVPQYVEYVPDPHIVKYKTPVPMEHCTKYQFTKSQFKPMVKKGEYTIYAPRFIEVPVPAELYSSAQLSYMDDLHSKLNLLNGQQALDLTYIEDIVTSINQAGIEQKEFKQGSLAHAWNEGIFQLANNGSEPIFVHANRFEYTI